MWFRNGSYYVQATILDPAVGLKKTIKIRLEFGGGGPALGIVNNRAPTDRKERLAGVLHHHYLRQAA